MNTVITVYGAEEDFNAVKILGFSLFAEPRVVENFTFVGYGQLTETLLASRLADYGVHANVVMAENAITITATSPAQGELVGVLRMGSVDYV